MTTREYKEKLMKLTEEYAKSQEEIPSSIRLDFPSYSYYDGDIHNIKYTIKIEYELDEI